MKQFTLVTCNIVYFFLTINSDCDYQINVAAILRAIWKSWLKREYYYYFFNFYFYFILLYSTVLVLPYVDMNLPRVYMSSKIWTPLPPPTPYHLSGSSPCTSPKHPVSCIEHRLAIRFLPDSIYTCFNAILPNHPTLSLSHRVQKSTLHICVSASVLNWGTRDLPCLMPDLLLWCSGPGACRLSCAKACGKLVP